MTKHRSSDRDTSVEIFLHWTRTVSRGKPYRASLSLILLFHVGHIVGEACSHLICKNDLHENSHENLLSESHYPLARKWWEVSHPFILTFERKKTCFPLTYPVSTSQVARKELPRNIQRFRDLFLKKTPNRSNRDRMILSCCSFTLQHVSAAIASQTKKKKRMR